MKVERDSFTFSSYVFFKVKINIKPSTKIFNTAGAWYGFTANHNRMRVKLVKLLPGPKTLSLY